MKVEVLDKKNNRVGTMELPEKVFKRAWNPNLVHQVLTSMLSNKRQPLANTKGRGEVRGGGKKPYAQKHTGQARAGSTRSPLWKGGGVTFGPSNERNFYRKINKKVRTAALYSVLSKKASDKEILIIDDLKMEDNKTKKFVAVLKNFLKAKESALIVVGKDNKNLFLAARNIPKIDAVDISSLNLMSSLSHKYILFDKEAVSTLNK